MNDIWMLLIFISLGVMILVVLTTFFISHHMDEKRLKNIDDSLLSTRIYVLDVDGDFIRYFDRTSLANQKISSLADFYNQFPADERYSIIAWIQSLLNNQQDTSKCYETRMLVNRRGKFQSLPCQLQVQKVNPKTQVIHIESHLLKNMANRTPAQMRNGYNFVTVDRFSKAISNNPRGRGVTFTFDFYEKEDPSGSITPLYFNQIKDIFMPFASYSILMREMDGHAILVTNLHTSDQVHSSALIMNIRNEVERFLKIHSLSNRIFYDIVAVINKQCSGNPDLIISKLFEVADNLDSKEDNKNDAFSSSGERQIRWLRASDINLDINDKTGYQNEVRKYIAKDKGSAKINFLYRPVFDTQNDKCMGYLLNARLTDTSSFERLNDLKNYAFKSDNENRNISRELFNYISNHGINNFLNEVQSAGDERQVLFFPLLFSERKYVGRSFRSFGDSISKIVLTFNEQDFIDISTTNLKEMVADLKSLKVRAGKMRNHLALCLSENPLILSDEIYNCFDYFFVDVSKSEKLGPNAQSQASLRAVLENLLPYRQPIILINMAGWNSVRRMLSLIDGPYLSADAIAPYDVNLRPIPEKNIRKINSFLSKDKGE